MEMTSGRPAWNKGIYLSSAKVNASLSYVSDSVRQLLISAAVIRGPTLSCALSESKRKTGFPAPDRHGAIHPGFIIETFKSRSKLRRIRHAGLLVVYPRRDAKCLARALRSALWRLLGGNRRSPERFSGQWDPFNPPAAPQPPKTNPRSVDVVHNGYYSVISKQNMIITMSELEGRSNDLKYPNRRGRDQHVKKSNQPPKQEVIVNYRNKGDSTCNAAIDMRKSAARDA
ncbi:Protein of unknown function [Gryllus bimaculatus]|nr:Protein of unknown function [Gryllus bimaculatus]